MSTRHSWLLDVRLVRQLRLPRLDTSALDPADRWRSSSLRHAWGRTNQYEVLETTDGYIATGGHGGIQGRVGEAFPPTPTRLTFVPTRRHTVSSDVNVRQLPASVRGVQRNGAVLEPVSVSIKAATGDLLPTAIPKVAS